jgi:hypothetical protein
MRKFVFIVIIAFLGLDSANAIDFPRNGPAAVETGLQGKPRRSKRSTSVRKPRSAKRAIREQEAADRKLDREYAKFVKDSRERAFDIQTPEVKARMKKDKKVTVARDNLKKKKIKKSNRKAGNKYN